MAVSLLLLLTTYGATPTQTPPAPKQMALVAGRSLLAARHSLRANSDERRSHPRGC